MGRALRLPLTASSPQSERRIRNTELLGPRRIGGGLARQVAQRDPSSRTPDVPFGAGHRRDRVNVLYVDLYAGLGHRWARRGARPAVSRCHPRLCDGGDMSLRETVSGQVDAPPGMVFGYLIDVSKLPEWNQAITDVVEAGPRRPIGLRRARHGKWASTHSGNRG